MHNVKKSVAALAAGVLVVGGVGVGPAEEDISAGRAIGQ
jgi:hypothetical protein